MKDGRFTSEQREAIEAPSPAVVTAGAGSGKTRVLVERFLEEARRCGSVRRVVAITFTRKAAAEMRGRIRERLLDYLDDGGKDAPKWRALWEELPFARIGTIDQFCASLLREHALQIGIDPDFSIADESESKDRESRLLDELLSDLDAPVGLRASGDDSLRDTYRRLLSYWSRYQLRKVLLSWGGSPRPLVS